MTLTASPPMKAPGYRGNRVTPTILQAVEDAANRLIATGKHPTVGQLVFMLPELDQCQIKSALQRARKSGTVVSTSELERPTKTKTDSIRQKVRTAIEAILADGRDPSVETLKAELPDCTLATLATYRAHWLNRGEIPGFRRGDLRAVRSASLVEAKVEQIENPEDDAPLSEPEHVDRPMVERLASEALHEVVAEQASRKRMADLEEEAGRTHEAEHRRALTRRAVAEYRAAWRAFRAGRDGWLQQIAEMAAD